MLYDSHIKHLAGLVDGAYTRDDIADSIGERLQRLETLPSLAVRVFIGRGYGGY